MTFKEIVKGIPFLSVCVLVIDNAMEQIDLENRLEVAETYRFTREEE